MSMTNDEFNQIRLNVINAPASIVESKHSDLLAVLELLDQREAAVGRGPATGWGTVDALRAGLRSAPCGPSGTCFHQKLHLLILFDAMDKLGDAMPQAIVAATEAEPIIPEPVSTEG
jgi:hypothetical protein